MQRPSQRVARPKGIHGGTRMGRRRRNLPHSQFLIIGHHWPVEPETVSQRWERRHKTVTNSPLGMMPEPIPQEEYCKLSRHVFKVRKGRTDVREKDWRLHQLGPEDHQAESWRARCLRNPKARKTGPSHTMSIAGYLRNKLS